MSLMIEACSVNCPYCGETFDTEVDCSAGSQSYYEDCFVCCRPILFETVVEGGRLASVATRRDDE